MGKPLLQVQSHSTEIKAAVMNSDLLKNLYAGNHEIKDIDISGKTENRKFILRIDFNSLIEHERLALLAISIIDQLAIILLDNRSGLNLNI